MEKKLFIKFFSSNQLHKPWPIGHGVKIIGILSYAFWLTFRESNVTKVDLKKFFGERESTVFPHYIEKLPKTIIFS